MTRTANKRFLKLGFTLLNLSAPILLIVLLGKKYHFIPEGTPLIPILVALFGVTAILAFVFLVVLGIFPHLFRFYLDNIANAREAQQVEALGFFVLEDSTRSN